MEWVGVTERGWEVTGIDHAGLTGRVLALAFSLRKVRSHWGVRTGQIRDLF